MQLIDQNGYPNNSGAGSGGWGGGVRFPASSNFAGPYVITWDGEGHESFLAGTWTEASTATNLVGNANGTTTLSGFSSVVGIGLQFDVTGTGVSGSTTVVSVNYATNTIIVSNAVTVGSGVTFTFTNNTYIKNANGSWTAVAGKKAYVVASNSGFASASLVSLNNVTSGGTSISVSSMAWSGGLVTVTTTAPHGRPVGYSLYLTFAGATPSSVNATVLCTVTGGSTYTFALVSNPGAITGTITYVAYCTNIAIYRRADEVDFMPTAVGGNGLLYRAPFKQAMANLNPAFIRFLSYDTVNNNNICRFENRSAPSKAGGNINWTAGPAYGKSSGANVITLAASTGTPGNSQTTPASMVHGEVAQCLISNSMTRAGKFAISAITKANPGQVTTTLTHGYSTGDVIQLVCGKSAATGNPYTGMVELNFVPVTITVIDANNFTIGIDTTLFTTFVAGSPVAYCCAYVTMQVGSGNDRTAYPVLDATGANPVGANTFTTAFVGSTYVSFVFDKNIAGVRSAGTTLNWTMGAWVVAGTGSATPGNPSTLQAGMPIEYMTAFMIEVNKLSQSPIHMWLGVPHRGLAPVDPDYSTSSDWALNAVSIVMAGANGYKGLVGNTSASLICEFSNETWNALFFQTAYMAFLNYIRNGSATSDVSTMSALRSTIMARNITNNSPYRSRVKLTLGVQGLAGYAAPNTNRLTGSGTNYFSDAWNTWQGGLTPINQHDACNPATYFDPTSTYTNTTIGTGTFIDDSAMFNGADNSGNGGGNYTGAANPTQAIANFVANSVTQGATGSFGGQTIANYCSQSNPSAGLIAQYATQMALINRFVIQYEGGTDWNTAVGSGIGSHTITSGDNLFLEAVLQSQAWATAQAQFFNNCATLASVGPSTIFNYLSVSASAPRWAYMWPDTYSGGVEGGAFTASPMWTTLGARNQALPN